MEQSKKKDKSNFAYVLLLCICGVVINFLGVRIALQFDLPLFLDCIGTILSAVLGGYLPGIIVGFITNLINGIFDYTTAYYGSISVLMAIAAAYFSEKKAYRMPAMIRPILMFTLIGGGLGSVLTWFLFGGGIGDGISAQMATSFYESGKLGMFTAQLSADLIIDLLDKTVTTVIVAVVLRILPEDLKEKFEFPRDTLPADNEDERKNCRNSLRLKILVLISAVVIVIATVVTSISLSLFHNGMIEEETRMTMGVAHTARSFIDPSRVDLYLTEGRALEDYAGISEHLASVADSSEDISYVYVYRILEDGCHVVFDPDTLAGPGSDPGTIIPFDQAFMPYVDALLQGKNIDPIVSNESYGWLLTVYLPVTDENGVCQCYVGVDMSMQRLFKNEMIFLARVISLFFGFFIIVMAVGVVLAEHGVIRPINAMAKATSAFVSDSEAARADSLAKIGELKISTGDEIENLYHAIVSTTGEVVSYIESTNEQNERIQHLQNGLILVLADLVESRDKCTGNHVKNTASYVRIIMERMLETGRHKEVINQNFIDEVVNAAPLHDVGKIHIPDHILNKAGRLNEIEYAEMKTHAKVGGEIIDRVMEMVDDDTGYLNEAHNLTQYHHERWDGKGYPDGLAGDEIPLSARIMAVADVFDALVSKRSYKEGMPFDKAISIIKEGAGTQFDPVVVETFLECQNQVRKVAEEANIKNSKDY